MASVTFSFNLDPAASASTRNAHTAQTDQSDAATAAKFQAVQAGHHSNSATGAVGSPACDGSNCYIVHGDGPGVTTLSIGEEDGGMAGESGFLTLPVIDGSEFLAPSASSLAETPSYDVTTLAIGEEDGGAVSASPEIGSSQSNAVSNLSDSQFVVETTPLPTPSTTYVDSGLGSVSSTLPPIQTVPITGSEFALEATPLPRANSSQDAPSTALAQSILPPIQTVPITGSQFTLETTPLPRAHSSQATPSTELAQSTLPPIQTVPITGSEFALDATPLPRANAAQAAPSVELAQSTLPPVETVPITEPVSKSTSVASVETPLPELKPAEYGNGQIVVDSGKNVVSVGDYDAYLASMGKGVDGSATAVAAAPTTAVAPAVDVQTQTTETASIQQPAEISGQNPAAVYVPPPLAPLEVFEFAEPEPFVAITYVPPPLAPIEQATFTSPASPDVPSDVKITYAPPPVAPERVEVVLQPAVAAPISPAGLDSVVAPRIKPATFTTPGPAALPPIETVPIQTPQVSPPDLTNGSVIGVPTPVEKPEAASLDAPRLTDEDFKITTLALGEEESGGG